MLPEVENMQKEITPIFLKIEEIRKDLLEKILEILSKKKGDDYVNIHPRYACGIKRLSVTGRIQSTGENPVGRIDAWDIQDLPVESLLDVYNELLEKKRDGWLDR